MQIHNQRIARNRKSACPPSSLHLRCPSSFLAIEDCASSPKIAVIFSEKMFSTRSLLLFIQSITLLTQVRATVYVQYNTSFPSNISTSCYDALIVDLACSANITSLRPSLYYPESVLTSVCTSACNDALNSYESDVEAACSGETFDSLESAGYVPLSTIPQLLRYVFNYTCLTDSSSGDYCNVIAATSIGIAADQSNLSESLSPSPSSCISFFLLTNENYCGENIIR